MESLRKLIDEIVFAFSPIIDAAEDPQRFQVLMAELGWVVDSVPQPFKDLSQSGKELKDLLRKDPEDFSAMDALTGIKAFVDGINAVVNAQDNLFPGGIDVDTFKKTIGAELLDYVLVGYLMCDRYYLGSVLKLAGIIRLTDTPASGTRKSYIKRTIDWERIGKLITDPINGFKETYAWAANAPLVEIAMNDLSGLLESNGLQFSYFAATDRLLDFVNDGAIAPIDPAIGMDLSIDIPVDQNDAIIAGIKLILLPQTAARGTGIALLPYASVSGQEEIKLSDSLFLSARCNADIEGGVALTIVPGKPIEVKTGFLAGAAAGPAELQFGLKVVPPAGEAERILVGTADATRISSKTVGAYMGARILSEGDLDVFAQLDLDKLLVVIKPSPEEADSFVAKVIGEGGVQAECSLQMRLSSLTGFHLTGSGGLEISLPLHKKLGPIEFQELLLALNVLSSDISFDVGANIAGELGPVAFSIKGVGVRMSAKFPDPPNGNLGPLDLGFGFKPPTGVGLVIDGGAITGGGFLAIHEDEYDGILQLDFSQIGLVAIGLITTRMLDGSKGFSMLIDIGVTFSPPFQLSMGFALGGAGGLIAIHRSANVDVLRDGIRQKTLNSILFPEDPIKNAAKIISDLRAVFPPEEGRFVVGPMLNITWGLQLLQMDIGVVIELPSPVRALILGQIAVTVPSPQAAMIELHVDVLGIIDVSKHELSVDATSYDSRIMGLELTGDGAIFLSSAPPAQFLMSLGGWHPKFSPPARFANLRRLTFETQVGEILHLSFESYWALTSNTVQFGARYDLLAKLDGIRLEGYFGFDALFYLSPFSFDASMAGGVSVKVHGETLTAVHLQMALSGPTPWHAQGLAKFEILWWDIEARFDRTWGDNNSARLDAVDPSSKLMDAIKESRNWSGVLPSGVAAVEALCDVTGAVDSIFAHPSGGLEIRQRVLPLDIELAKFNNAPIAAYNYFTLQAAGEFAGEEVAIEDQFARAQFEDLPNDQKLSIPSYEPFDAGIAIGADAIACGNAVSDDFEFEPILIDDLQFSADELKQIWGPDPVAIAKGRMRSGIADYLLTMRTSALAGALNAGNRKYEIRGRAADVGVTNERYIVTNKDDMNKSEGTCKTRTAADRALRDAGKDQQVMLEEEVAV